MFVFDVGVPEGVVLNNRVILMDLCNNERSDTGFFWAILGLLEAFLTK